MIGKPANSPTVEAWHFLPEDGRLRFGKREKVEVGEALKFKGKPALCECGLHASIKALDALQYAPGPICCRVVLGGEIVHDTDKLVATERTVLWMADATNTLHEFACWCAERALQTAKVDDERCWKAIETKRKWLRGEATDDELAAARAAARDAARDAARAAARDAARAAARDAAWDAVWAAAWDAARAAARDAAWAAAREAQNKRLEQMLFKLHSKVEAAAR